MSGAKQFAGSNAQSLIPPSLLIIDLGCSDGYLVPYRKRKDPAMVTTSYGPAGGSPTVRAQSAAALHPARPDSKPSRLQREIEPGDRANDPVDDEISFGPFRLLPARRLLLEADKPVHLGSRAFDLLIALVERPGELITKSQLIETVWPHTFVVEGNLKLHIAALRRAMGMARPARGTSARSPGEAIVLSRRSVDRPDHAVRQHGIRRRNPEQHFCAANKTDRPG